MKKQRRGSVLIFCTVLMAALGTIILSTADLGQFVVKRQDSQEMEARWNYAVDSVRAISVSKLLDKSLIVPSTTTYTINNVSVSSAVADAGVLKPRQLSLAITGNRGRFSRTRSIYVGERSLPAFTWFTLGFSNNIVLTGDITTDGDVFALGNLSASSYIISASGDVFTNKSTLTTIPTGASSVSYGVRDIVPPLDSAAYSAAADSSTSGNQTVTTLAMDVLGFNPTLNYNAGNVSFKTTYTGFGTYYVKGNATINQLTASSAFSRLVLIVEGNVSIKDSTIDAFIYCSGTVSNNNNAAITVNGALWGNNLTLGGDALIVNKDPVFWNYSSLDASYHVPGMW